MMEHIKKLQYKYKKKFQKNKILKINKKKGNYIIRTMYIFSLEKFALNRIRLGLFI